MVLALSAWPLAGCSLFQIPKRVDTVAGRIADAAGAKAAMTGFDLQTDCAAAAQRFYSGIDVGTGHALTGFSSNYNLGLNSCFMTYGVTWANAGGHFHKTTIVDPVRHFLDGSCIVGPDQPVGKATHCWVRWDGNDVRGLSARQFGAYEARFMVAARGTTHE